MRLPRTTAALAVAFQLGAAALSHAQDRFPTPNANVNAVGEVAMCASGGPPISGTPFPAYVPCTSPLAKPLPVTVVSPLAPPQPLGTVTAVGTGTTGAVTATLSAVQGKTLFLCSFDVSAIGGTATVGPITVTGLGNTLTYQVAATASGNFLVRTFTPCAQAANNTNIVVLTTADGTASAVDVNIVGLAQ